MKKCFLLLLILSTILIGDYAIPVESYKSKCYKNFDEKDHYGYTSSNYCYKVGRAYYYGQYNNLTKKTTAKNLTRAFDYYKRACDLSPFSAKGCNQAAHMSRIGKGVRPDLSNALKYAEKSCGKIYRESSRGCGTLAEIYMDLNDIHKAAKYSLRDCYYGDSDGCKETLKYAKQSCNQGNLDSCKILIELYDKVKIQYFDSENVNNRDGMIRYYSKKACELGSIDYCEKDTLKSAELYKVIKIRSDDTLNVRRGAGTHNQKIGDLPYNAKNIQVIKCKNDPKGVKWCKVSYGSLTGWVSTRYLSYYSPLNNTASENGKKQGVDKVYYKNGSLKLVATYINGKIEGLVRSYWENGNLKEEVSFTNGKMEGLGKSYYENGELESEAYFKNGKIEGVEKWYKNGNVYREYIYENGIVISNGFVDPRYNENGDLKTIAPEGEDVQQAYRQDLVNVKREIADLEKEISDLEKAQKENWLSMNEVVEEVNVDLPASIGNFTLERLKLTEDVVLQAYVVPRGTIEVLLNTSSGPGVAHRMLRDKFCKIDITQISIDAGNFEYILTLKDKTITKKITQSECSND